MALINCPECGKEISDTIKVCPNCGYRLNSEKRKESKKKIIRLFLIILALLIIIGGIIYFFALRPKINREKAFSLLEQGKYVEADRLFASLPQTEEIVTLRKQIFYESRVLQCALRTRDILLVPESMRVYEAVCLYEGFSKNNDKSTDEKEVREYEQPEILLHYSAQTRGGGVSDGFQRYSWSLINNEYSQHTSVDSLTLDSTEPYWLKSADTSERLEYYNEQREISIINIALLSSPTEMSLDDAQLERVNKALQNTTSKSVDFIPNNEIVPLPTPIILQVTPEPKKNEADVDVATAAQAEVDAVQAAVEEALRQVEDEGF